MKQSSSLRRYLPALVPIVMFGIAIVALHRLGGEFQRRGILAEFSAIEPWRLLAAIEAEAEAAAASAEALATAAGQPWTRR